MSCYWLLLIAWIVSMPITYAFALYFLEKDFFMNGIESIEDAELIVVLGGALTENTNFSKPDVSLALLERIRFSAYLQRQSNLPILVTGLGSSAVSEGEKMKEVLENEFHASVDFVESQSHNTKENALFSYEIIKEQKIKHIVLVSSSWHLKRANLLFLRHTQDLKVTPIGNFFYANQKFEMEFRDFLPNMSTFYYQRRFYSECLAWCYQQYFVKGN